MKIIKITDYDERILMILLLLHSGGSEVQDPDLSQYVDADPCRLYPRLHSKVRVVAKV